LALLVAAGCASVERPSVEGDRVALPTPLRSFDASVAATIDDLRAALAGIGRRLDATASAYRPSEPASLLQVPRVVMRADLADPDDGYVVIYAAGGAPAAAARASDLAAHLGSGFGLSNFPADTQFAVAVIGDTVVFTTWSPGRSSDPPRAEAAFDAVATVGSPVEVVR
jgi:hypothetical protein